MQIVHNIKLKEEESATTSAVAAASSSAAAVVVAAAAAFFFRFAVSCTRNTLAKATRRHGITINPQVIYNK